MPRINLVHCLLHPTRPHGLLGYAEVIETVQWGLEQLGREVTRSINQPAPACLNIFFGAQVLPVPVLESLPQGSIIYNFEQMRNLPVDQIRPEVHFIAKNFRIWDYSTGNREAWAQLGARDVQIVPIGYAPVLTRISKPDIQDIDVLIYGGSDEKRLRAFHDLAEAGLTVLFVCGLYGEGRDSLIARSKLVLNINRYDRSRVFEIVRVSYLLANKKAVISTFEDNTLIEDDIQSCIRLVDATSLAKNARFLADNADARRLMEQHGFDVFSRRDIRKILKDAFG